MANSYVFYTGNGVTDQYQIPFDYLSKEFVKVYIDGVLKTVTTHYTFSGDRTLNFVAIPPVGATIYIVRDTSKERLVEFRDASILVARDLDVSSLQAIHIAEESKDIVENSLAVDTTNNLTAQDRRITDVANPVDAQDVATKNYVDTFGNGIYQDALDEANRAFLEAENAEASADNAAISAGVATTKATEASASATLAKKYAENPVNTPVTGSEYSAKHHASKAQDSANAAAASKLQCDAVAAQVVIDGQTSDANADAAAVSASDAAAWAASASASATAANDSKLACAADAATVNSQINTAITKANEATAAATTATTKASEALNSANLATTKAQVAVDNADLATTKATAAEASALAASGSASSAASNASIAQAASASAVSSASAASSSAGTASSSKTDAVNARDAALAAQDVCEDIRDGLQTASTHSHNNKSFLDGLNALTIAGYNVIRSQTIPQVGRYPMGTFCIVDAYFPKQVFLNIGLAWIEIPASDALYGKIIAFDDVKLLWRDVDGGQISAVGDDPNWSLSGPMYNEDGSYTGINEPVNRVGKAWPWDGFTNMFAYSEQLDNAAWVKTRATVVANSVAAPDGQTTADTLKEDSTASNTHTIEYALVDTPVNSIHVVSIYAKANGRSWLRINEVQSITASAYFDLTNGVVGSVAGTGSPSASIEAVGGGWYKCSMTFTAGGSSRIRIYLASDGATTSYTGNGTSGIYLWGAQLTKTSKQMPYIKTEATPVTVNKGDILSSPMPWYEWSGPQYTNLLTYSEDFSNAAWAKTAVSITGGMADPFGGTSARRMAPDTSTGGHQIYQATVYDLNILYTLSAYVKAAGLNLVRLHWNTATTQAVEVNLSNGSVTYSHSSSPVRVEQVGNGWYKISISMMQSGAGQPVCIAPMVTSGGLSYAGDGVSGIDVYGVQFAKTDRPVPYIKTEANAVTVNTLTPVPAIHGDKGVWCGPSYTNIIYPSHTFDSPWAAGYTTLKKVALNGPIANQATKVIPTLGNYNHNVFSLTFTPILNGFYTLSLYAKKGEYTKVGMALSGYVNWTGGNGGECHFDLVSGTSSWYSSPGLEKGIIPVGDDWFYCYIVVQRILDGDAPMVALSVLDLNGTRVFPGDGVSGVYMQGAQLTQTRVPMPYVPTYSSPVTVPSAAGTSGNNGIWWEMAKEPDGVELIYNGGFDTNVDGWVSDTTHVPVKSVVSGQLRLEASTTMGAVYQTISTIVGVKYRLTVSLINAGTSTSNWISIGTSTSSFSHLHTNVGTVIGRYTFDFVATTTTTFVRLLVGDSTTKYSLWDNISVQRLTSPLMQCFENPQTDGVELVTNGTFDSATGWTANDVNFVISGGLLNINNPSAYKYINYPLGQTLITGSIYEITFTTSNYVSGGIRFTVSGGGTNINGPIECQGNRVWKFRFIANSGNNVVGIQVLATSAQLSVDNVSLQKLKPATSTVAALVTMGAGSDDLVVNAEYGLVSCKDFNNELLSFYDFSGAGCSVRSRDSTTTTILAGEWSRNEQHLKIVQTNALGTQFRVGNKRIGIDAVIQWGSWVNFDGSFNTLTALRLALGNAVPLWFKRVMVSNLGGMSDVEIEARMTI